MAIVTTVSTVSYRYYEKRNRSVAELNIVQMCESLGKPQPKDLWKLSKHDLIMLALACHAEFPE